MTQEAIKADPIDDLLERIHEQVLYAASRPITRKMYFPEGGYTDHLIQELRDNPKAEIVEHDSGEPLYYNLTLDRGKKRDTFYICVDLIERGYGGPEEGGWWYDSGTVMTYEAARVQYRNGEPSISVDENAFLRAIAHEWIEEFGGFDSDYRSSMRPSGNDYRIRVEFDEPEDWNGYQPYC